MFLQRLSGFSIALVLRLLNTTVSTWPIVSISMRISHGNSQEYPLVETILNFVQDSKL